MASDPAFLLGEYGARLDNLEATVGRMDKNIEFLVQRETVRETKEGEMKRFLTAASSVVAAVVALLTTLLKEWAIR